MPCFMSRMKSHKSLVLVIHSDTKTWQAMADGALWLISRISNQSSLPWKPILLHGLISIVIGKLSLLELFPLHLSHLGHNPMKIILMPPSPLIRLHSQICMHSRTILAINHPNLMVPPLNRGHLLPLCHTPQPSPQATPRPARFLKKLSIMLQKKCLSQPAC